MTDLLTPIQEALDLPVTALAFTEAGALPSTFAVTDLASASIGAAGQAVARLLLQQTGRLPAVTVDRRLASFWFSSSLRPDGWATPPLWDPIAGDYACADGWIRLHTNAPPPNAYSGRPLTVRRWPRRLRNGTLPSWNKRLSRRTAARHRCVRGKTGKLILKVWRSTRNRWCIARPSLPSATNPGGVRWRGPWRASRCWT